MCHTHKRIADQTRVKVTHSYSVAHTLQGSTAALNLPTRKCTNVHRIMQTMTRVQMQCTPNAIQFTLKYMKPL